jgi:hypothetical protein
VRSLFYIPDKISWRRDILILAKAGYGLLFTSVRRFPPSVWGKISTFFQIAGGAGGDGRA